jgi:outer membrane protein assembly factor BamB
MRNAIFRNNGMFFLLLFFIVVVISSCGENNVATIVTSPFSNIPQGRGSTPEPGTDGKPIPYPYGHSESMIPSNGVDFLGSDNGKVYAFQGTSGTILWQNNTGDPADVFAVANGTVYAYTDGDNSGAIYALSASSGNILWRYNFSGTISGALPGAIIYVTTAATGNQAVLYALRASDGALLWRADIRTTMPGLLGVSDGIVYYAEIAGDPGSNNINEVIAAFQGDTGHILWQLHAASSDGIVSGISTASNGVVYLSANFGAAYAVRVSDGALLWHVARAPGLGNPPLLAGAVSPLLANGIVYISGRQGSGEMQTLYALRASNGTQIWSKTFNDMPGPLAAQPLLVNGVLYVNSVGDIYALGATDGSTLWQSQGVDVFGPISMSNGQIYGSSEEGVFVVSASNGALLWKQAIPDHGTEATGLTPQIVGADIMYVASENGIVQALRMNDGHQLWRYAIPEKGMPTGVVDSAFITFTSATSYQQALTMITDLGLQTSNACAFSWKPQSAAQGFPESHDLLVAATVASAPLWLYRLKASPNVSMVNVWTVFSCPMERIGQQPLYIPKNQVGTYVRVTFSGGSYDAALNAINNLSFRLANPCYEQARARGSKPTWSLMDQETSFSQTHTLLLATTDANAAAWRSQLQSSPGVTKIETLVKMSC